MKKNSCGVYYKWVTTQNQSHIRDKVKIVLDLSNYATKKELHHATGADRSDFAAKKDFITLNAEADKLDFNKESRWFR